MDSSLSDIKFYMVRCVPLGMWVGKHCTGHAFMTDAFLQHNYIDNTQRYQPTWFMKDPKHAKVWTNLAEIRTFRKRAATLTWKDRQMVEDPKTFTSYEVVQFPEMIVIPLAEV